MSSTSPTQPHLNDSIREIDGNSWLVAQTLILTHLSSPTPEVVADQACWSDGSGGYFAVSTASEPLPESQPLAEDSPFIRLVHSVDNQAAVWQAGEAFIKGHGIDYPDTTREHVTLQYLKDQQPEGFDFPSVLRHFETGSRYFLFVSRVPGQTLEKAWPSMNEDTRQYYINKVAHICDRLAEYKGEAICGVDGRQLLEPYLMKVGMDALSPQQLRDNCAEMSMDLSAFVFYHCDLSPTNLLVNVSTGSLSIID